jgi:hypothetical protein
LKFVLNEISFLPSFLWRYSPNRVLASTFEVSSSHTIRQAAGLLWTSDQPVAKASTYPRQHNVQTQDTNIHALSGIRSRDPSNQAAADLRLRPCGHRDRLLNEHVMQICLYFVCCYHCCQCLQLSSCTE